MEWAVAVVALVVGLGGGYLWARWRQRIAKDVRAIRSTVERIDERLGG